MRTSELYEITVSEIDLFLIRTTKDFYIFKIFGNEKRVAKERINSEQNVFIHISKNKNKISRIEILNHIRFEFDHKEVVNLAKKYETLKMKTPKGEGKMITDYKVKKGSIVFKDIDDIAFEVAVEKVQSIMGGTELKVKGDKVYLIKDGTAEEVTVERFKEKVVDFVTGKTEAQMNKSKSVIPLLMRNTQIIQEWGWELVPTESDVYSTG